jgi:hypothetical protein
MILIEASENQEKGLKCNRPTTLDTSKFQSRFGAAALSRIMLFVPSSFGTLWGRGGLQEVLRDCKRPQEELIIASKQLGKNNRTLPLAEPEKAVGQWVMLSLGDPLGALALSWHTERILAISL